MFFFVGCNEPLWYNDLYCDDINNNEACGFDGGDCCGEYVLHYYCTECICYEDYD